MHAGTALQQMEEQEKGWELEFLKDLRSHCLQSTGLCNYSAPPPGPQGVEDDGGGADFLLNISSTERPCRQW